VTPSPSRPSQSGDRSTQEPKPAGKVSAFVGSRLLMIGLMASVLGLALLIFAGIKLWLILTTGVLGRDLLPLIVGGCVAFALLSVGGSAWRTGLKYVNGERAVSKDLGHFLIRRLERRARIRGR